MLYNRPALLMCKQCGLTRVADNYHEAKARAEVHQKKSRHYDFELVTLEECPGRNPLVHRKDIKVVETVEG
jgi:hypothetical protein